MEPCTAVILSLKNIVLSPVSVNKNNNNRSKTEILRRNAKTPITFPNPNAANKVLLWLILPLRKVTIGYCDNSPNSNTAVSQYPILGFFVILC